MRPVCVTDELHSKALAHRNEEQGDREELKNQGKRERENVREERRLFQF